MELRADNKLLKIEVDPLTGIIKLKEEPESDCRVYLNFIFEVPVRFINDNLSYHHAPDGSILLDKIELMEVFE